MKARWAVLSYLTTLELVPVTRPKLVVISVDIAERASGLARHRTRTSSQSTSSTRMAAVARDGWISYDINPPLRTSDLRALLGLRFHSSGGEALRFITIGAEGGPA
ncbi:hypothetical protein BDV98DRAFT_573976, partial [Pterulicium gracile]